MAQIIGEMEITRHNVTPSQFLAYVRAQAKKRGLSGLTSDLSLRYFSQGEKVNGEYWNSRYTKGTPETRPAQSEVVKALPYDQQTYVLNFDGSVYNEIVEFTFDDDKKGVGYYYILNTEADPEKAYKPAEEKKEEEKEMLFPKLTAACNAHFDEETRKFRTNIESVTAKAALDSWYYRDMMTPKAFEEVKAAAPDSMLSDAVKAKMIKRFDTKNEKHRAQYLARLERAEKAAPVQECFVTVTWAKNRTWGANPTAHINVDGLSYEDSASGCGYDKESAAICGAFSASPAIMRILYEARENGVMLPQPVIQEYAGIPWWDGGCGVSSFYRVFDLCGYTFKDLHHSRGYDCYMVSRKAQ